MPVDSFFHQRTIAQPASITGVGIHTGYRVQLQLLPAPAGHGIRFRRVDAGGVEIASVASSVSSLELATCLGRDDVTVSTVEHLLAAVAVLGIDNLIVELNGPEVPILDGSARPFLYLLQAAGVVRQEALRRVVAITRPIEVRHGDKRIVATPYPGLRLTYSIDFGKGSAIGRQHIDLDVTRDSFERELAPARTFALERDLDAMRRSGLGLGGTVDNCVVFGDDGPINTTLRYEHEPVRHKALDAIGDFALLGCPLWGHIEVEKGGHLLHFKLIEALNRHPECWTYMVGELRAPRTRAELPAPHAFLPPPAPERARSTRPA